MSVSTPDTSQTSAMMAPASMLLPILLCLLAIDSLIQVGFIGSMVHYLHQCHNDIPFQIAATNSTPQFGLFPNPKHLLVNQGHTSNGAAGTAFVLVSVLGFIVLWLNSRDGKRNGSVYSHMRMTQNRETKKHLAWLYPAWVVSTILSFLLTMSALIYTFVVTQQTDAKHSMINLAVGAAAYGRAYPDDEWTPENWYKAMLRLDFVDPNQKADIRHNVHLMQGWRWNLIPMFLLGFAVMVVAVMELLRKTSRSDRRPQRADQEKEVSKRSER